MNWRTKLQEQRGAIAQRGASDPVTKLTELPKCEIDALTKLTQPSFVGFVSAPPRHSENIAVTSAGLSPVRKLRAHLLELADQLGIDGTRVHHIPENDTALWAAVPEGSLPAYLLALGDTAARQAGKVPIGDTMPIYCACCGPVFGHPGIAAVLPVMDGWPRALGCPWCFVRKAGGYISRPSVAVAATRRSIVKRLICC